MSLTNPAAGPVLSTSDPRRVRRCSQAAGALTALAAVAFFASNAAAQCTGFNLVPSAGAVIDPGVADIGNHCDDCVTNVPLPFPFAVYGTSYSRLNVSSNGNVQFATSNNSWTNGCLPQVDALGVAICANWDDLLTNGTGDGIFTSVTGQAPNRVFNIEWRARYFSGGGRTNFEIRLFEDNSQFELVYGQMDQAGSSATVGVQHTIFPATQYLCNSGGLVAGTRLTFTCTNGPIPPIGNGSTNPSIVTLCGSAGSTLLAVNVSPGFNPPSTGLSVVADLSNIGGSTNQALYNDGTHGDATAGDNTFSLLAAVPLSVPPGSKSLPFSVADAQGRSSSGVMGLTVNPCPTAGPDVFVARLTDIGWYGSVGNITAYSIGTDACNAGDVPVIWIQSGVQHPVIAQNFYRLKNGRFEQIGQSWLKHGFSSTNSGTCGTCTQPPMGGQQLGVGCSDAYGSGLNGGQGYLGPRSEVNATTGAFIWPHGTGSTTAIGMRLQVLTSDVDPAQNAGAQYFGEAHYITADDAQWTTGTTPAVNGLNNATYQAISIPNTTSAPTLIGTVHRMSPAIQAWKDLDPSVKLMPADYVDTSAGSPGIVARFWVAAKATDNHNGTWHYEYAVYNHNADRSGGSFSVPVGPGVVVSNIGFHGVFAHSGEPFPNTATNPDNWPGVASGSAVSWTCPEPYVGPNGINGNAIRWGTMYNFRFDANIAPVTGTATVGLFKPGTPTTASASGLDVPGLPCQAPSFTTHPVEQTVCPGGSASFSVVAEGTAPLRYEWRHGNPPVTIPGAISDTYTIAAATAADAGTYDCVVTNSCGSLASNAASLSMCVGDFNCDGGVDGQDVESFFAMWESGAAAGDVNGDGGVDGGDVEFFFSRWEAGC